MQTPEPHPAPPAPLIIRQGANLPHWTRDGATYSITFRLADSLPREVLDGWLAERQHIVARAAQMGRTLTSHELARLDALHSQRVQRYLDAGHGACWLSRPELARMVHDTLFHFEDVRHTIEAWCIMPNHVHTIVRPLPGFDLPKVLHAWKGFSSSQANEMLQRTGTFWQPESYDHLIRDADDFAHCVNYVLNNPREAGLQDWPWVGRGRIEKQGLRARRPEHGL